MGVDDLGRREVAEEQANARAKLWLLGEPWRSASTNESSELEPRREKEAKKKEKKKVKEKRSKQEGPVRRMACEH